MMNLPDLPESFCEIAGDSLFETLVVSGYSLHLLEDAAEVAEIIVADDAFSGFRKYPVRIIEAIREVALEGVNRLMVEEMPKDEV